MNMNEQLQQIEMKAEDILSRYNNVEWSGEGDGLYTANQMFHAIVTALKEGAAPVGEAPQPVRDLVQKPDKEGNYGTEASTSDEAAVSTIRSSSGNSVEQGGNGGWISAKPELDKECVLLTANFYRHPKYPENSYWSYRLFEIAKIECDEGWYWGVLEEGMEWGDIADIKADMYQIVAIPQPPKSK
jgi:hypothetical protein